MTSGWQWVQSPLLGLLDLVLSSLAKLLTLQTRGVVLCWNSLPAGPPPIKNGQREESRCGLCTWASDCAPSSWWVGRYLPSA